MSVLVEIDRPSAPATTAVPPTPRRPGRLAEKATPYLYLLPACFFLGFFVYKPLIATFQYSFDDWNLVPTTPRRNVGWSNYVTLFHLPALWQALGVSAFYVGAMVVFGVALPLVVGALIQHVSARARTVYRAVIFLPVLVSPVVAATLWSFLLTPNGGLVDPLLGTVGLGQVNWFAGATTARVAIALIGGWKIVGFAALVVSAGLAAISADYYEAAAIDGARHWQVFRRVTLPLLSPTIVFLVITVVLLSSQILFPLVNALTEGGPTNATTDLYYFLYSYGFTSFDVGVASAAATVFFLLFGTVALALVALVDRLSFSDD